MSLETEIKQLKLAIESLTKVMGVNTALIESEDEKVIESEVEKAEPTEEVKKEEDPTVSADDVKAACLTAARSAKDAKAKVKKLLKEFDANVVKDIAVGDRAEVLRRLESGEY